MTKKYVLTEDYHTSHDAKAGTFVYLCEKADYGLARDATRMSGEEHVSVTLKEDGDYPFFTYPTRLLKEVECPHSGLIGGKLFAGVIINAEPYHMWPRCITGVLEGRDHHNRGFDNHYIRTSVVDNLIISGNDLYAITQNSAYLIKNMNLLAFLDSDTWLSDIEKIVANVKGV